MTNHVYIVIGRTNGTPCEVWGVAVYSDEASARAHSEKAAAETKRIQSNVKRALRLRGKPFPEETLERFRAGNRYDPKMRILEAVTYDLLQASLAEGLSLQQIEKT